MATLVRELRKELEKTVTKARVAAETGARKALEEYAVHEAAPYTFMDDQRQQLRERLRARGLQAGDVRGKDGAQSIHHLCAEFAYEHWHRMLFARFLAENSLLIPLGQEPGKEIAISLEECRQMAQEENKDWITIASEYAQHMLPAIFRSGDPVLELSLPLESRNQLENWLKDLPTEVFLADDSLGWVYQFWQAKKKDEVNDSGVKIGADEIAPVTQLFTEDYMVLFLLHNTLGAWWAAKRKAEGKPHDLLGYEWTYLRFKDDGSPAAGSFEGWPTVARDLKVLDPCMGSGHFLVFALPILVGFRMEEERLSVRDAIEAVLRDNLFGLEIDPRCTQIAAFNLALTAWKMAGGHFQLPPLNLACSGLGINTKEEDWVKLAGNDPLLRETMKELYQLFNQAPVLGSLVDPTRVGGHLFASNFDKAAALLKQALSVERRNSLENELAMTARGLMEATSILCASFVLVATNVPYLGRGKQSVQLMEYCEKMFPRAKSDLATALASRCEQFVGTGGTYALVVPQNLLSLGRFEQLRRHLLSESSLLMCVRLGENSFQSPQAAGAFPALIIVSRYKPDDAYMFSGADLAALRNSAEKAQSLETIDLIYQNQNSQFSNPDSRISFSTAEANSHYLSNVAEAYQGAVTGDLERFTVPFWEIPRAGSIWEPFRRATNSADQSNGLTCAIRWESGCGALYQYAKEARERLHDMHESGQRAWGKQGVAINRMRNLSCTLYNGTKFDNNVAVLLTRPDLLPAVYAFCSSSEFLSSVRHLDQTLKVTNRTLAKVPFDVAHWEQIAKEKYPNGLPRSHSNDPTQWLFNGHPHDSEQPLQVAVARLLGYRWPRQTGSSFPDCPSLGEDGLEQFASDDGIVCLSALQGKPSAADRFSALLAAAFGNEWPKNQQELLKQAGAKCTTLEDWLQNEFFAHHCEVFHNRPFIWHISDGLDQGFHALVNYHKLAAPNDGGKRILEKLTYTYLGEWIERQRNQQKQGIAGSDARLASALHLQEELKRILAGNPPYDIFVRWKPLHDQPMGWEPDIDDGVRLNIRPFVNTRPLVARGKNACILRVRPGPSLKWTKDKGTEPHRDKQDFPWFWSWDEQTEDFTGGPKFDGNRWNDLHYTLDMKRKARAQHDSKAKKGQPA